MDDLTFCNGVLALPMSQSNINFSIEPLESRVQHHILEDWDVEEWEEFDGQTRKQK